MVQWRIPGVQRFACQGDIRYKDEDEHGNYTTTLHILIPFIHISFSH